MSWLYSVLRVLNDATRRCQLGGRPEPVIKVKPTYAKSGLTSKTQPDYTKSRLIGFGSHGKHAAIKEKSNETMEKKLRRTKNVRPASILNSVTTPKSTTISNKSVSIQSPVSIAERVLTDELVNDIEEHMTSPHTNPPVPSHSTRRISKAEIHDSGDHLSTGSCLVNV